MCKKKTSEQNIQKYRMKKKKNHFNVISTYRLTVFKLKL